MAESAQLLNLSDQILQLLNELKPVGIHDVINQYLLSGVSVCILARFGGFVDQE